MDVFFRADSSLELGSGHIMRCLTLAEGLYEAGTKINFICRELPGNINKLIEDKGFVVHIMPEIDTDSYGSGLSRKLPEMPWQVDAEQTAHILTDRSASGRLLIVDHYALDFNWENCLRPFVDKIMVIDDLANRPHDCEILLDQNLSLQSKERYDHLVTNTCRKLLGPAYALLRTEFAAKKEAVRVRTGAVNRIFVFFGGSDPTHETLKALEALKLLIDEEFITDVVVGSSNPDRSIIKGICDSLPWSNYYCQVTNMAEIMLQADLALGAGGSTALERCSTGLPSIIISVADNQEPMARALEKKGSAVYLGKSECISVNDIVCAIKDLTSKPERICELSSNAINLVDGLGVQRVIDVITSSI